MYKCWKTRQDSDFFSLTGCEEYYLYEVMCTLWAIIRKLAIKNYMMKKILSQVVFHFMFGTFKKYLSILLQITPKKRWYTSAKMCLVNTLRLLTSKMQSNKSFLN